MAKDRPARSYAHPFLVEWEGGWDSGVVVIGWSPAIRGTESPTPLIVNPGRIAWRSAQDHQLPITLTLNPGPNQTSYLIRPDDPDPSTVPMSDRENFYKARQLPR